MNKLRARSLVVSDLRSETKVSSLAASSVQRSSLCSNRLANVKMSEADGSGSEEIEKCPPPSPAVL